MDHKLRQKNTKEKKKLYKMMNMTKNPLVLHTLPTDNLNYIISNNDTK